MIALDLLEQYISLPMPKLTIPMALILGALLLGAALLVYLPEAPGETERATPDQTLVALTSRPAAGSHNPPQVMVPASPTQLSRNRGFAEQVVSTNDAEATWRTNLSAVIESPEGNEQVVDRLLGLLPTLPEEGQVEAAQHMVNLLEDKDYQRAMSLLVGSGALPPVQSVVYADMLNRPNQIKLHGMLTIMAAPGHPLREEVHDALRSLIGHDYGADVDAWARAADSFLLKEREEESLFGSSGHDVR